MDRSFPKEEKLKSQKLLEELFDKGHSLKKFPVRLIFLEKETMTGHQVAFAVPKKSFKSAVSRNQIKRQLREAYRLQKELIPRDRGKKFVMIFLFIGKEKLPFQKLQIAVASLLKSL